MAGQNLQIKNLEMKSIRHIILFIAGFLIAAGCTYNNEEDLYPETACDTLHITFSQTIHPIFQQNCMECHNAELASGGHDFTTYTGVVDAINEGHLLGAIRHEDGFIWMPLDRDQLPACPISQIEAWVNQGMPDN